MITTVPRYCGECWAWNPFALDLERTEKHFQRALLYELTAFKNEFDQRIPLLGFYLMEVQFLRTIYGN